MRKIIGIGIIGLGFIGKVYAENINESSDCELVAVYDVDYENMKSLAKNYRVQVSKSLEDLVSNEKVDAVIIASPTVSHAECLERVIPFGKPILCEKPLTHDITKIRGICELIERKKIPVMVGFNRRFDKNYATLKKKIDRGDIGKVEMVLITHRGPKLPPKNKLRSSGGQYLDSGSHFYDLLRWLTKDEVEEVFTFGTCLIDLDLNKWGDTDTSIILLKLKSGALCEMNFCRQTAYGYDDRIEVLGSDGLLVSERPRQDDVTIFRKNMVIQSGLYESWFERFASSYKIELSAFVHGILQGEMMGPSVEDGIRSQIIGECVKEAYKRNRPIKIKQF